MRYLCLILGIALMVLGAVWTYEGWFAPRVGDGFGQLLPWLMGPPSLFVGLLFFGFSLPIILSSRESSGAGKADNR